MHLFRKVPFIKATKSTHCTVIASITHVLSPTLFYAPNSCLHILNTKRTKEVNHSYPASLRSESSCPPSHKILAVVHAQRVVVENDVERGMVFSKNLPGKRLPPRILEKHIWIETIVGHRCLQLLSQVHFSYAVLSEERRHIRVRGRL